MMGTSEQIHPQAQEAEKLGLKTRVLNLAEIVGAYESETGVLLLVGENGKAVHDFGNMLEKRQHATRSKGLLWRILKVVVIIAEKPWAQTTMEKLFLGWLTSKWKASGGQRSCNKDAVD